ncbi:helix-turn-helix domain-containing protein [Bacteroides sp. OttesenSCG-928-J23]|nr:helix-turn-helix domain-containing protein [Bacteroides sp. OttesenSCG-928-J23]
MENPILQRITKIKENENISRDSDFCQQAGVSYETYKTLKQRDSTPKLDFILKLIGSFEHYSLEWLLTGKGEMKKEEKNSEIVLKSKEDVVSIPIVDIGAAAGISGYENPSYLEVVDTIDMPFNMVKRNGTYYCIRIRGESMAPTLLDSGYLIVRLLDRSEWENLSSNLIYVISTREGAAYVKRIKNRLKEKGFIVCMSDNPDKVRFNNFNLLADELHSILYAEWYFTAKMPNIHQTYYQRVEDLEDQFSVLQEQMNSVRRALKLTH